MGAEERRGIFDQTERFHWRIKMLHEIPILFHSSGNQLAGLIYRNTNDFSIVQPGIIVTGSWLTVKEQMPALYAKRLARDGFTVLIFDFAGFGQSSGEPRQAEIPLRKMNDIHAAAKFLRTVHFVEENSVGCLGICASAQYALAAIASGAPINALVSVAGWLHDIRSLEPFYGGTAGINQRLSAGQKALKQYITNGDVEMVPAYRAGDQNAAMFFELDYYANPNRGAVPEWKNEMAALSWLYWFTFDGMRAGSNINIPTLFVHSDGCVFPDNVRTVCDRIKGQKKLVWSTGTQTDFYDQDEQVQVAASSAVEHFRAAFG
jgi:uncharacterized protein